MGESLFTLRPPKPPKQRFQVIHCFLDELAAKLEELAADGWMLTGCELSAKPGHWSYVLLTKFDYPEPTQQEREAFEKMTHSPHAAPMDALFRRIERIASHLEEKMGIPPEEPPSDQLH
jgi:hypothetical protein